MRRRVKMLWEVRRVTQGRKGGKEYNEAGYEEC